MGLVDSDHDDPNEETALLLPRRLNKSVEEFMAMSVDSFFFWLFLADIDILT